MAIDFDSGLDPATLRHLGYRAASDAIEDPRGVVVRSTPWRRTYRVPLPEGQGGPLFRKVRLRRPRDAVREWLWLERLPRLGFAAPRRAFFARCGRATAVGMLAVDGDPMDELLRAASRSPEGARRAAAFVVGRVAPMIRRLHDPGIVYRDLYWNHLFAVRVDGAGPEPALVDVERAFRPRWRRRRWVVKDLAGLLSSGGHGLGSTVALRFLRGYLGGRLEGGWKRLARAVVRKAERIRRHVPKWG